MLNAYAGRYTVVLDLLTHGLGWVGSAWVEIFQFLVGSVGSTKAEVL